jgi:hypothetical protein
MKRSNHKLAYKYYGPYLITQKVGKVAYKLQLPESDNQHKSTPWFSQLNRALFPGEHTSSDSTLYLLSGDTPLQQPKVLSTRLQLLGGSVIPFAQVQWLDVSGCSSENMRVLMNSFPAMASRG